MKKKSIYIRNAKVQPLSVYIKATVLFSNLMSHYAVSFESCIPKLEGIVAQQKVKSLITD